MERINRLNVFYHNIRECVQERLGKYCVRRHTY